MLELFTKRMFAGSRASDDEKKHTTEFLSTTSLLLKEGQRRQLSLHCTMENPTIYQFPDPTGSSLKMSVLASKEHPHPAEPSLFPRRRLESSSGRGLLGSLIAVTQSTGSQAPSPSQGPMTESCWATNFCFSPTPHLAPCTGTKPLPVKQILNKNSSLGVGGNGRQVLPA